MIFVSSAANSGLILSGLARPFLYWNTPLKSLQQQKSHLEKKIERERLVLGDLPELSVQILELCHHRGRVTVAEVVKVTGANRNTIKDHFKALTRVGHLTRHGAGRGTWYGLT